MNDLLSWLSDPSRTYADGLALYERYSNRKDLAFFKDAGSDPSPKSLQFRMLVQRLHNTARILKDNPDLMPKPDPYKVEHKAAKPIDNRKTPQKPQKPKKPGNVRIADNPIVELSRLPEGLQQKYLQNKELYKEIAGAHAAMKESKSDEERRELYSQIQALESQHQSNWKEIDEWWANNQPAGDAGTGVDNAVSEAVQKEKRITLLENYLRRYKGKPGKEQLYAKYEEELKSLQG